LKQTDFTSLLQLSQEINSQQTTQLKEVVNEFPYFQSARALYLKGLKNQDSFKYNNELKITAAYTTDRTILFNFITSDAFTTTKSREKQPEKVTEIAKTSKVSQKISAELELGKPLSFNTNETHSFNQWLQLSVKKPISRDPITPQKTSVKTKTIIDRFIANNPKISKIDKTTSVQVNVAENEQHSQLMTETLAKVYLEQKKYENAIQAYRILSLKYPEKSGFFADQIKRIQILQKNKL